MNWTTDEIKYLEEHAGDDMAVIAKALGRTEAAIRRQASRYGISLRRCWTCPKCGHTTYKPLSAKTGWCAACTMANRRQSLVAEVRELEEAMKKEEEERRARQCLYSRKSTAKKKLKIMSETCRIDSSADM